MTQPDAGWYTDPDDPQQVRWWNGLAWSDQRKDRVLQAAPAEAPAASVPPVAPYVPMSGYVPMAGYGSARESTARPTRKEKDQQIRKNNSMAYTGLLLSLLALLINPFAILSILGIVFSALGLAKSNELEGAGYAIAGRGTAKAGLGVGILGLALFAFLLSR